MCLWMHRKAPGTWLGTWRDVWTVSYLQRCGFTCLHAHSCVHPSSHTKRDTYKRSRLVLYLLESQTVFRSSSRLSLVASNRLGFFQGVLASCHAFSECLLEVYGRTSFTDVVSVHLKNLASLSYSSSSFRGVLRFRQKECIFSVWFSFFFKETKEGPECFLQRGVDIVMSDKIL